MKYNPKQYAQALYESLKEVPTEGRGSSMRGIGKKDVDLVFKNFYTILLRNNDLKLINKIIEKIEEIDKEKRGVTEVKIASAKKIDPEINEKLQSLIKKPRTKGDFVRGKAEIKQEIDPSLIGGLKIQIGDLLIDGSIKAKLNKLRQSLI